MDSYSIQLILSRISLLYFLLIFVYLIEFVKGVELQRDVNLSITIKSTFKIFCIESEVEPFLQCFFQPRRQRLPLHFPLFEDFFTTLESVSKSNSSAPSSDTKINSLKWAMKFRFFCNMLQSMIRNIFQSYFRYTFRTSVAL